jgi:hypothetical protein
VLANLLSQLYILLIRDYLLASQFVDLVPCIFYTYVYTFACLGNIPTTTAITFKNCIADKGLNAPPSVTASCFKLDSGGTEFKIGLPGYIFLLVLDILKRGVIMVTYFSVNILIIIVYVRVIVSHGRP